MASKILSQLLEPIGLFWFIGVIYTFKLIFKGRIRLALFPCVLLLISSLLGNGYLALKILARTESPYVFGKIDNIPKCDAIIMLGGTHTYGENEIFNLNLNASVDRILLAIELGRQGKCDVIVLGGGSYVNGTKLHKNGNLISNWIRSWKVLSIPIIVLPPSSSTRDEAIHSANLASKNRWQKLILITSANHMKRAEGAFRKVGLDVMPVAADFKGLSALQGMSLVREKMKFSPIPTIQGLEIFSSLFHEFIGYYYYKLKGWI